MMATAKTEEEVRAAYGVARKLAQVMMNRFKVRTGRSAVMDLDDFVQEGMLAWLEGKSMYFSMMRAHRDLNMTSRYQHDVKGVMEPFSEEFNGDDENLTENEPELFMAKAIDVKSIIERIEKIENDDARFAVMAYLLFDVSLRELGAIFEKSHEWVRLYLIEPEIKKLREEFNA